MLYNPKWEAPKHPYRLDNFIAWLEMQPPDRKYDYGDCVGNCLVGQYFKACGLKWSATRYVKFITTTGSTYVPWKRPYTFGAALKRAIKCRDMHA